MMQRYYFYAPFEWNLSGSCSISCVYDPWTISFTSDLGLKMDKEGSGRSWEKLLEIPKIALNHFNAIFANLSLYSLLSGCNVNTSAVAVCKI